VRKVVPTLTRDHVGKFSNPYTQDGFKLPPIDVNTIEQGTIPCVQPIAVMSLKNHG
jgi:hypothetical protein